jgi:AcrR family transcriptional regulator
MLAEARKQQIMQASIQVFGVYGYKKTSMKDLAEALDISRPALYQYYKNKEAVFLALVDYVLQQGEQAAIQGFNSSDEHFDCLLNGVLAMERAIFEPIFTTPNGKDLFVLAKKIAPDLMSNFDEKLINQVVQVLEKAEKSHQIRFCNHNSMEAAQLILAGIDGIKRASQSQEKLDQQITLFLTIFWHGLATDLVNAERVEDA